MRTICLQTNQNRLIANLRHAFNQSSMLGELLQNARRAQAGAIHFTVEDNSLTIRDDGSGITDLQTLIHIAESGWDEQTQTRENAFGMGVLSTLYFAERLTVRSDGKAFSAATAAIIRGEPIQVFPCDLVVGTEIRLDGIQPTQPGETLLAWADRLLRTLCEAFPVPVWLNGHEVLRPLADPALQWRETPWARSCSICPLLARSDGAFSKAFQSVDRHRSAGIRSYSCRPKHSPDFPIVSTC